MRPSYNELTPHNTTHPGTYIATEIEAGNDLNPKELAHFLGVSSSFLSEIIKGKRQVTVNTARRLEKILAISAEY